MDLSNICNKNITSQNSSNSSKQCYEKLDLLKAREFEKEMRPYIKDMNRLALRRTQGNFEEAQELLQDSIFRAFCSWDYYEKKTNMGAWLARIIVNVHNNNYRHEKVVVAARKKFYIDDYSETIEDGFFQRLDQEQVANRVREALGKLNEDYRKTLVYYYFYDIGYDKIAEIEDCPIGTVKSRMHRAKRTLKKILGSYNQEPES